ncbi:AraC family transcriptional regulator [Paenibacillus sp. KS-LC4]|uniref:AraC family transcriptional regulator n=1 Tax=Paenibacillus sp. KS-LC4 TaxID=2979727 RepID=UPI0030CBA41D
MDYNMLAGQLARGMITIEGVYMNTIAPGIYHSHTTTYPTRFSGFVFALRGHAIFEFNGTAYEVAPGSVVHGGAGMLLKLEVAEAEDFQFVLIHYRSTLPDLSAGKIHYAETHYLSEYGSNTRMVELLQRLCEVSALAGQMNMLREKELFYSIMNEWLVSVRSHSTNENGKMVEQALDYIHHHYMEPLTAAGLAELHSMGKKQFAYAFHKYSGRSPIDYLIEHRMKRAKYLLTTSNCSVSSVARNVGYEDAHYFSRLFRKHSGCSPSMFRQSLGNNPPDF